MVQAATALKNSNDGQDKLRFLNAKIDREIESSQGDLLVNAHQSHYLGDFTCLTYTYFGRKIYVDTRDISLTPHILTDGRWEPWVCSYIESNLAPGMTFYDIGANCGFFTLLAAHLVGPTGSVVAFEPQANLVNNLRKSLSINGFDGYSYLVPKGASNEAAELKLFKQDDYQGSSSLVEGMLVETEFETISTVNVGSELREMEQSFGKDLTPDFIKIDVEGFEPYAWDGMEELLGRGRPCTIVLEFSAPAYDKSPWGREGFLDMIIGSGFSIQTLEHSGQTSAVNLEKILQNETGYSDLVLTRL